MSFYNNTKYDYLLICNDDIFRYNVKYKNLLKYKVFKL